MLVKRRYIPLTPSCEFPKGIEASINGSFPSMEEVGRQSRSLEVTVYFTPTLMAAYLPNVIYQDFQKYS